MLTTSHGDVASSVRVLLVEDDDFTRTALEPALVHHGVDVVAVPGAQAALAAFRGADIDVLVVDLDLGPGPTGLDVAIGLRRERPDLGVVVLTTYEDPRLLSTSLGSLPAGARYLVKQSLTDLGLLVEAITSAVESDPAPARSIPTLDLSDVQIETLRLLACGLTNADIARIRVVEEKSVEQAVSRMARKLGIEEGTNRRVMLARAYYQLSGAHLASATLRRG